MTTEGKPGRLRWRKDPRPTGLSAIRAGPRGSSLTDGAREDVTLATAFARILENERAALLAAARERDEQAAELARLWVELERERQVAREYRSVLADVRSNLHAMGKRPDDALAQSTPADTGDKP